MDLKLDFDSAEVAEKLSEAIMATWMTSISQP